MRVENQAMVITGTSRGLGRQMAEVYLDRGWHVFGCSRGAFDLAHARYAHFQLDVGDERVRCENVRGCGAGPACH